MQMQLPGVPLNLQSGGQPIHHPAGMAAAPSWVRDFQSMRLGNSSPRSIADPQNGGAAMNGLRNGVPHGVQTPAQSNLGAQPIFANPYMPAESLTGVHNPGMFLPFQPHNQSPAPFQTLQQEPAAHGEYSHYPQTIALSHSTEEALDAAFAAYDQDFEHEMHQWMGTHGPKSGEPSNMAEVQATMEAIADQQDLAHMRQERVEQQQKARPSVPIDDGATTEFRKAAMDILDTVGKNQGEKFKNSSFLELMRRICDKEVVLQGEDLVDVKTGTVLGNNNPEDVPAKTAAAETNGTTGGGDVAQQQL